MNEQFRTHYTYLTALAFCDLFSCILTILSIIEYISFFNITFYVAKYRNHFLFISLYITPIANTLQALSVWLICAFSIHRCQFISKPILFKKEKLTKNLKEKIRIENKNKTYLFKIESRSKRPICKTNCNLYLLRCFCVSIPLFSSPSWCMKNKNEEISASSGLYLENEFEIKIDESSKKNLRHFSLLKQSISRKIKIKRPRFIIIVLYIFAFIYILPQFFEKQIVCHKVDFIEYCFIEYSKFGKKAIFQKIYHLYLYMFLIFIFPFILILTSNYILLRAFITSKKRIKKITERRKSYLSSQFNGPSVVNQIFEHQTTPFSQTDKKTSVKMVNKNKKGNNKSLGLTLSLFGVVFLFLVCQIPQIVSRIISIHYPQNSFLKDSKISLIFLDISNFFVMLNSSINFVPYIAFGPRKFRKEFSNIFKSPFKRLRNCF